MGYKLYMSSTFEEQFLLSESVTNPLFSCTGAPLRYTKKKWIQPVFNSFRYLARRQLERLESMGYKLLSAFEEEFMLYEGDSKNLVVPWHDFLITTQYQKYVSTSSTGYLLHANLC